MADELREHEARLVALRARRQKWNLRYEAAQDVRGKATERAQCKANIGMVDKQIAETEKNIRIVAGKAVQVENREIVREEEKLNGKSATNNLPEILRLAAECDEHAEAL